MQTFDSGDTRAVAALLCKRGVLAYPAAGAYGFGGDPGNHAALQRRLAMKRWPQQPGTLPIADAVGGAIMRA